ncbi:Acid sphingomyelinase-like phosphodiesterase 3b [Chamberlinius hualienensis]
MKFYLFSLMIFFTICIKWIHTAPNGYVWHVTDFHWDLNYTQFGGDASSMCWSGQNSSTDVGQYGNYACDSPWSLVTSTLNFMKSKLPDPDLIIWTGDDDAHVSDDYFSYTKVIDIMKNLTNAIKSAFPNTPVMPVFGNHDAYPKSKFPPTINSPMYMDVADLWRNWLGEEAYTSFQQGGYYTKPHPVLSNVIIIGLNTPVYYNKNTLVTENDVDPLGQLSWLDQTLTDIAANNQKAYIVAHIPPGMFGRKVTPFGQKWFRDEFNKQYMDYIVKHSDVIIGQFYGHDHTDSYKLYYDSTGIPVNIHFAAPAVTPWNTTLSGIGPNNPGVRLFQYNTANGQLINYEQYYLNLSMANIEKVDGWTKEYDFLSAYNIRDLSPVSVDAVTQTFITSNRTYFDKYYYYNSVSYAPATECDDVCQQNHYCGIVKVDYNEFIKCNNNALGADDIKRNIYIDRVNALINYKWNLKRNFPALNQESTRRRPSMGNVYQPYPPFNRRNPFRLTLVFNYHMVHSEFFLTHKYNPNAVTGYIVDEVKNRKSSREQTAAARNPRNYVALVFRHCAKENEQQEVQSTVDKLWNKIHATGHWSSWSQWKCDALCGNGILTRKRVCIGSGEFGIPVCEGSTIDRNGGNCSVSCPPMDYIKSRIFGRQLSPPEQTFYAKLLMSSEAVTYPRKAGDMIQFNCDYENNKDILMNFTGSALFWEKNGKKLFYDFRRMTVEKFSNLIMWNLTRNDTGVYTCNIIIPKNTTITIAIFSLTVTEEAYNISLPVNAKSPLRCNSEALAKVYPDIQVKWMIEGTDIILKSYNVNKKTKVKEDVIANLKVEQTGMWICSVTENQLNKSWITNRIRVQVLPPEYVVVNYLKSKLSPMILGIAGGCFGVIVIVTIILAIFVERKSSAELLAEFNRILKICEEFQSMESKNEQTDTETPSSESEIIDKSKKVTVQNAVDDIENFEYRVKKKIEEIEDYKKKSVMDKMYRKRVKTK